MKIKCHENTGMLYISTENIDDHFKLGKLAERLKGAMVYSCTGGRELQISVNDLLECLLKS
jgi:hypothetical protein